MSPLAFLAVESLSNTTLLLLAKVTLILIAAWISRMILRRSNPRWRILTWRVATVGLNMRRTDELQCPVLHDSSPSRDSRGNCRTKPCRDNNQFCTID